MTKKFIAAALLALIIGTMMLSCKKEVLTNVLSNEPSAATADISHFVFSVSEDRMVIFSPGNLQYRASDTSWRFASQQYEFIGQAAGNTTSEGLRASQSQWIDLFGWGTTGLDTMVAQPYCISTDFRVYRLQDTVLVGESLSNDHGDWGACKIKNAGTCQTTWYTLSRSEWDYLLHGRKVNGGYGDGHTFCLQYIDKVYGMIIFPDSYLGQVPTESLTTSSWKRYESQGCVFLPAAGIRNSTTVTGTGTRGFYWTRNSSSSNCKDAYYMAFRKAFVEEEEVSIARYSGLSVRLVRDSIERE